ncbi:MAG TPA: TRAP transporter TatT component family protein [Candidatus Methylomirabilis sp.]|nr:TRAP transporter TatT component family protein [Candidatus Methylomirabilis sp.]
MIHSIGVLLLTVVVSGLQQPTTEDPDRLYADRANLASAQRAAALWEVRLAREPNDFEAAWKLARACYWLGGHVPANTQRSQFERGIDAARRAVMLNAGRPEGHFWMAANMGALAESSGLLRGLMYRGTIKEELETVLTIDPAFQQGSADRALGRWYLKVPGLFGGSNQKSLEHLQRSLTYYPDSTASLYFLAETLIEMNRHIEARAALQKVLDAPLTPEWAPEDREFKEKARAVLDKMK